MISPDFSSSLFRGTVAKVSREIPIFLCKEEEMYGMSKAIYNSVMDFKGRNRALFNTTLTMSNISFEGPSVYEKRRVIIVIPDGKLITGSAIPPCFFGETEETKTEAIQTEEILTESSAKRKKSPGERGPGKSDFKSRRTASILSKQINERIVEIINENLKCNSNQNNRKQLIKATLEYVRKHFDVEDSKDLDYAGAETAVVHSAKKYIDGLRLYGGKFSKTQETIDTIITALVTLDVKNVVVEKILGISRKRVASARKVRAKFDDIIQREACNEKNNVDSDDSESSINLESGQESISPDDDDSTLSEYNNDVSDSSSQSSVNSAVASKQKEKSQNVFREAFVSRRRKVRKDKLNLEVVRDFCHDVCRLDTFNSNQKIHVHNYDGSYDYHQVHIRNQSLKEYYKQFETSQVYGYWQRENKVIKNGFEIFPTIKYRSFTNAFCPCCLNQKQRDCANHVQVSLVNALKALGNLRRLRGVADAIKSCGCVGHSNENYLRCPTSLKAFIGAVSCPEIDYPSLSCTEGPSICIKEQEMYNINESNKKEKKEIA